MSEKEQKNYLAESEKALNKNLVVKNGKVSCADGQGVVAYLNKWIKAEKLKDGDFLSVARRGYLIRLTAAFDAFMEGDYCDYCYSTAPEVRFLIKGARGLICSECVDICNDIIADEKAKKAEIQNEN